MGKNKALAVSMHEAGCNHPCTAVVVLTTFYPHVFQLWLVQHGTDVGVQELFALADQQVSTKLCCCSSLVDLQGSAGLLAIREMS